MSESDRDPPRLSQSGDSAFLRDAIRESKSDLPDEARLAAIALKLGPIVGIAGGAAGGGGAAAAGGGAAAKASVAPAAAKIGGMTLGMKIAAAAAVTVAVGGTAVVAPRVIANRSAVTAPTAMVSAPRASSAATSTSTPIDLSLPPASASAAPLPVPKPTATMIVPPNPDDELRTIERAQDALNVNDFATALSLCNDDAIVFPHGPNAQERESIAINALVHLGKMDEAKARAKKFEKDYPGSAQIPHVRQLVGGSP